MRSMPPLVRRYLKTAIAFLVFGVGLGFYMLGHRELAGRWPSPWLISAHTHVILVGFVMLMIFGVALWMFPRPAKDDRRFDPRLAEVAYWLLVAGTVARVAGELARPVSAAGAVRWTVVAGGGGQLLGIVVFFWTMWSRIRASGKVILSPPSDASRSPGAP
jgi:heme/copper-type cytochrome/quinol oxidase subunit 1